MNGYTLVNTFVNFDCYNWTKMIDSFKALKTFKKDEEQDHVYIRICDNGVRIYRVNTVDYVTRQCFSFSACTVNNFDNKVYYCYKLKTADFLKAVSEDIYQCVMVLSDNELRFMNGDNNKNITVEKTEEDPETVNNNYYKTDSINVYFSVLTDDLKDVFNSVTWMLPVDQVVVKSVRGVCFQFEDDDRVIRITGTNGHILLSDAVNITTNRYSFGNIQEFIIPQKNIKIIQNLIKNHRELEFDVSNNTVWIRDKGMFVSFELLPEKYPQYKQLQVKDTDSQITLNSKDIMPALKTKNRIVSMMPVSEGKMFDFSEVWSDALKCDGKEVKAMMSGNLYNFYMSTDYLKGLFKRYKQVTFQNNKKTYAHNIFVTNRPDFIGVFMGCVV